MSERKYLDAETLKQHLFAEATLGYIKTLADVNRVIEMLFLKLTRRKWPASSGEMQRKTRLTRMLMSLCTAPMVLS